MFFGIVFHDWEKVPYPGSRDAVVANNVFVGAAGNGRPMVEIRHSDELGGIHGIDGTPRMSANRYFQRNGPAAFVDRRIEGDVRGPLAKWKELIAGDASSTEGDPMLDATMHLAAESPCIDRADPGYARDDFDGSSRSGAPDTGADERIAVAAP